MDEYEHLTDAQWQLYDLMSQISEDCFCAGWIGNCEYDIWQALQQEDPWGPHHPMSPRHLRLCQKLSTEIEGWIYWADGQTDPDLPRDSWGARFAPMARWLTMVEEQLQKTQNINTERAIKL